MRVVKKPAGDYHLAPISFGSGIWLWKERSPGSTDIFPDKTAVCDESARPTSALERRE